MKVCVVNLGFLIIYTNVPPHEYLSYFSSDVIIYIKSIIDLCVRFKLENILLYEYKIKY